MEKDIEKVQCRFLELAACIKDILESNNVDYMIGFGTLLGAVRHKGFIPWDDDFDFIIMDDGYDKALEQLRQHLPEDMVLEDRISEPLYFHAWAHVKDKKTIAYCKQFPQDNIYSNKGISVDLYKGIRLDERDVKLYRMKEHLLYREREYNLGLLTELEFETYRHAIMSDIEAEKKRISTLNPMGEVICLVNNENIMRFDEIFPLKTYTFENIQFHGPNDASTILKNLYGLSYMELPPLEKRRSHYDDVVFLSDN